MQAIWPCGRRWFLHTPREPGALEEHDNSISLYSIVGIIYWLVVQNTMFTGADGGWSGMLGSRGATDPRRHPYRRYLSVVGVPYMTC